MPEKKVNPAKKKAAKKNLTKGQTLNCEICGLAVTVDQVGDLAVEEDRVLLCCDQPMKAKKATAKAAK